MPETHQTHPPLPPTHWYGCEHLDWPADPDKTHWNEDCWFCVTHARETALAVPGHPVFDWETGKLLDVKLADTVNEVIEAHGYPLELIP